MEATGQPRPPFGSDPMTRAVIEALPAHVCLLDPEGRITAINGNWERFASENGADLSRCGPGVNYLDVCRGAAARGVAAAAEAAAGISDVLDGRCSSFSLEYPCHGPDQPRWFLLLTAPLQCEPGGALLSHVEITDRKLGELALHESEFRLRAVINTAGDGIISIDGTGRIDTFNAAAERMFGYDRSEVIGKNVSMLMPLSQRETHDGHLELFRSVGLDRITGRVREVVAQRKDGASFPVELSIGRVDSLDLYTAIVRDISEQRAMQEQLLTIAESEQRRIGQDLHDDVGQELTGLGLMVESLVEALEEAECPELGLVDRIRAGLNRAQERMRDLCRGLIPVEVDAEGLMAALNDLIVRFDTRESISFRFECREPVRIEDNRTATHLYRIAQEAVSNAVRHGRPRSIVVRLHHREGCPVLEVCDDGVGIPEQAGKFREGMGLRIMRYRASLIDATLRVEPVEGGGTRISCAIERGHEHGNRFDLD